MTPRSSTNRPRVVIKLDGVEYAHRLSDLTAIDARDFSFCVGFPLSRVWMDPTATDLPAVAGLVWLARRREDPQLAFEDVAKAITYDTELDVTIDMGGAATSSEAQAGDDPEP